jgi:hypothetical protein
MDRKPTQEEWAIINPMREKGCTAEDIMAVIDWVDLSYAQAMVHSHRKNRAMRNNVARWHRAGKTKEEISIRYNLGLDKVTNITNWVDRNPWLTDIDLC